MAKGVYLGLRPWKSSEGNFIEATPFFSSVRPTKLAYPKFYKIYGPFKDRGESDAYAFKHKWKLFGKNPSIPRKVLSWREKQKKGSIMRPSTFKRIEKEAKKAGYTDPKAVAGKAYQTTLMAKYRAAHSGTKLNPKGKESLAQRLLAKGYKYEIQFEEDGKEFGEPLFFTSEINISSFMRDYPRMKIKWVKKLSKNPFDPVSFAHLAGASAVGTMIGKKLLGNPRIKLVRPDAKIIMATLKEYKVIPVNLLPPFYLRGLEELQEKGLVVVFGGNIRLAGSLKKNPPASAVKIYDDILAIEAKKGQESLWPEENFRHDFKAKKGKAAIFGMPDGSLLVKGQKRLWKKFKYGKEDI